MNILLMAAMFPPIRTGSSFYAQDLASAMTRRGHAVTVVTLKNKDAAADDFEFPVHRLDALHLENVFRKYFKHFRVCSVFPRNFQRMDDLIAARSIDIVLVVSHYHDMAFVAARCARRRGIPLVCTINTQLQMLNPLLNVWLKFFDRLICGRLFLPACSGIVSLDTEVEKYLIETYPKRVSKKSTIIPYGIHGERALTDGGERDYRFKGQLIGVGAVIQQRNFLFSIALFHRLLGEFPGLRFKIIGHIYFDETVRFARRLGLEDRVIFVGERPREVVLEEMVSSDAYLGILSGKYVGLGSATVEAMMAGLPVIANAPPGLFGKPALVDMHHYVFAAQGELEVALKKTAAVLRSCDLREKIGLEGRRFALQNLNWDSVSQKLESYLTPFSERARRASKPKGITNVLA